MKRLILLLLVAVMPMVVSAQTTTTGTITDPQGNPYSNGSASAQKSVATGQVQPPPVNVITNGSGTFSMTLPSPASYIFTICAPPTQIGPTGNPTPVAVCFSNAIPIAISGGSQDVSSSLNAVARVLGPNITGVSGVVATCTANQVPFYAVNGNVVACSSVITISGATATVQNETVTGNETVNGTNTVGVLSVGTTATVTGALAANGGATVNNGITVNGGSALNGGGTDSGTWTHSGNHTFNGATMTVNSNATFTAALLPKSIDTATVYATQFSGSDASAKIQAAITALPSVGGIVSAVNLTDAGGTGSTIIDPGAKSVTLLLGPYTYQIQRLVLETNFRVIGLGDGSFSASDVSTTVLQACVTCAAINTVVLGTNGGNGGPIQHASMEGLRIYGATADTAIGMNLKTVNGAGTGIWYSSFRNMCVGACGPSGASANGFSGGAIALDATGASTINQFLDFTNVAAVKTNGGGPALSLLGTDGQINFTQCQFDGTTRNDGTDVVLIANSSGNSGPYSIIFNGATVQHGTTGFHIAGAFSITAIGTHFELVGGAILVNSGVSSDIGGGLTFIGSTCQNFCGNNTGAGYFAKTTTPNGISVKFIGNQIQNTADAIYVGFTNTSLFTSIGDESDSATTTIQLANVGNNFPLLTTFTTTAAVSETVTVAGASASSHCWAEATNATAAALTGVFLSGPTTNAVTLNHSATSGGTFNISCTPN